jgi:hypothetical protein
VHRGLTFFWRLVGVLLLVGVVSASAYAVGHATRKEPSDLEKILVASQHQSSAPAARPTRKHESSAKRRRSTRRASRHAANKSHAPKLDRSSVVVAVLNATTVSGLARSVADQLAAAGFARGTVSDDSLPRTATTVFYAPGNRRPALQVAKVAKVGRRAVRPMDPRTRSLVGTDTKVVVTVGSDRARS